jgi:site-specific DNA-adenine methylase
MNYGVPYMGSKSKIASLIGRLLPRAENFYDLFGGGGAITHYMATARAAHFKRFIYNEFDPAPFQLFKDGASGKYSPENFKPEWIGPEDFKARKDKDPYVKYIWSFGNSCTSYLFGAKIQKIKRMGHQAVVFGEITPEFTRVTGISAWPKGATSTKARRLYLVKRVRLLRKSRPRDFELEQLQQLQQLERLEQLQQLQRLQQLQQLERLERLEFSNLDYRKIEIKENSIVYCDPPYAETAVYEVNKRSGFDSAAFLSWAEASEHPVFVSEYADISSRLRLFANIPKRKIYKGAGGKSGTERLFMNSAAHRYIKKKAEVLNG